ncbi:MAG: helix-turn-helix transcriptional regulator [Bacilli bacterium]|nr:helix-turn-helix transcriptional regulator [Bacilli bacterium]
MARIYEVVRKNLKFYRNKAGLTQEQLSELIGVSHDFIRQVESKKVEKNFSMANVEKAAEVFGIEIHEMFIDRE